MSRARVALLVVAAALLVGDGPATSGATPATSDEVARAEAATPDAAAIAARVGRLNPHLTESERHRIGEAVLRYSAKYGLDPILVTAVIEVESSARPWARSPKGALGLMQVMPYMMRPMGVAGNPSTIETNIEAGCLILAGNIRRLGEEDGISAYFWGSQIRGVSYLNRVQAARDRAADELRS
ncbi:MAG: transglycosylase SLT domain-containing protein [Myxococcota bacterium]|nr:transglycosylase SLT domain-containing protein [Myxococcota bacterium]